MTFEEYWDSLGQGEQGTAGAGMPDPNSEIPDNTGGGGSMFGQDDNETLQTDTVDESSMSDYVDYATSPLTLGPDQYYLTDASGNVTGVAGTTDDQGNSYAAVTPDDNTFNMQDFVDQMDATLQSDITSNPSQYTVQDKGGLSSVMSALGGSGASIGGGGGSSSKPLSSTTPVAASTGLSAQSIIPGVTNGMLLFAGIGITVILLMNQKG